MLTRVVLLCAFPTPWDNEDRIVGSRPLPLTDVAVENIRKLVAELPDSLTGIYFPPENEACAQAAKLLSERFSLRARAMAELEEPNLGLWEGLARPDVLFRFPSVFPEWKEHPLSVTPPDAEPLADAVDRLRKGLQRILRRNRGVTISIILRPMALQIVRGLLTGEDLPALAIHLHEIQPSATIELDLIQLRRFIV